MRLTRPARPPAGLTLTPLVDVMLILLIFFMVTSTYLNLDMLPMVERAEEAGPQDDAGGAAGSEAGAAAAAGAAGGGSLLIRLSADGRVYHRGATLDREGLRRLFAGAGPEARIHVLPSAAAPSQSLVTVLEAAAEAGAADIRVVRLAGEF